MLGKIIRKKPWHRPVKRTVKFMHRRYDKLDAEKQYYFKDLGSKHIHPPAGRALIAFMPDFVGYLYNHPEVGPDRWEPGTIAEKMERFSVQFSVHQMLWDSVEMVRQLISRDYVVDYVCGRHGELVEDVSKYDVIIDEWNNLPEWAGLNPSAKKLFYATGAHWIFHNKAEMTRHEWLFRRRGVELPKNRQVPHLLGDAHADLVTTFGNKAIDSTFGANAHKIRKLCTTAVADNVHLQEKDWAKSRRTFLYFASAPWWHKGLDLVVEAFLKEPALTLNIVTSGVGEDSDFWRVYGSEISASGNIQVHGFLDTLSEEFYRMAASCVGIILPSASEGCAGSVVQSLHHGLIPIVTDVVGLEFKDEWPALAGRTDVELIDEIRARCNWLAEKGESELEELRWYFWRHANMHHTRAHYSRLLSKVLDEFLAC